jgi:SAM-dependent methyltransferase
MSNFTQDELNISNRHIQDDEFVGDEQICRRAQFAAQFIRGDGIEIGALHKPLAVDASVAHVRYVDYKTQAENRKRYPELADEDIVETTIIDDGFILSSVPEKSVDFVIANHALEHSPDPIGTLAIWLSRLNENGVLFMAVPVAEKCYDAGRPLTTISHLLKDHTDFVSLNKDAILETTEQHLHEFIEISGANIRKMNNMEPADPRQNEALCNDLVRDLAIAANTAVTYSDLMDAHINKINRIYDIHYHTFSPTSYEEMITVFCKMHNAVIETVVKNGNGECIAIVRKKTI